MHAGTGGLAGMVVIQCRFLGLFQLLIGGQPGRPGRHLVGDRVLGQLHHQRLQAAVPVGRQHVGMLGQ